MPGATNNMQQDAPAAEFEDEEPEIKALTAQEAQAWRARHPETSLWRVVAGQALVGAAVALIAGALFGVWAAWSAAYGAVAVVLPAALFARGLRRNSGTAGAGAAMARLFVWEIVKLLLTIALLAAAPKVVQQLNWLALLAGLVFAMKAYWIAFLMQSGVRKTDSHIDRRVD